MKQLIKDIKNCKKFSENCKKYLIIAFVLGIITTTISSILPSITGNIINTILDAKYKNVIVLIIIMAFLELLLVVLNLLITKNFLIYRQKFVSNIRKKICRYALNLQLTEYQKETKGTILIRKIKSDSMTLSNVLSKLNESSLMIFSCISTTFILLYINKIIGLINIICIIILLLTRYYGIKKSLYYKIKNTELLDKKYNIFGQIIKGAKDIKVLKMRNTFENKTENLFTEISDLEYKSEAYQNYAAKIATFLESVFLGIIIITCVILIKKNLLTVDEFVIIYAYRGRMFSISQKFSNLISQYGQFSISFNRMLSILDYNAEKYGSKTLNNFSGKLQLENISFSYKDTPVIQNLNLKIKENSFVSIVGMSGAGKSTILSLLSKIIQPDSGKVYLDNIDINELTEDSIRNNISLVAQQPFLFNLSIKENLSIINDDFEYIKKVCKKVGIHNKIERLEKGYETILDEDATNLSGGEKQRLAIARAILANTKVILLDEITNNLDYKSIKSIIKLLKTMNKEYTIIMVTHDTNITEYTDRVIVLEKGCIVGDGTHQQLLMNNKYYQKIYRSNQCEEKR